METIHSVRPLLAIAVSFFGALLSIASQRRPSPREFCATITPLTRLKVSRMDRLTIEDLRQQTIGGAASLGRMGVPLFMRRVSLLSLFFAFVLLCQDKKGKEVLGGHIHGKEDPHR